MRNQCQNGQGSEEDKVNVEAQPGEHDKDGHCEFCIDEEENGLSNDQIVVIWVFKLV